MTMTRRREPAIGDPVLIATMIGTRNAAFLLVAITALVTTALCLVNPVMSLMLGAATWNLPLPAATAIGIVAVGCTAQAGTLLLCTRHPLLGFAGATAIYLAVAIIVGAPNWLEAMQLVAAAALFLLASRSPARLTALALALGVIAVPLVLGVWAAATAAAPPTAIVGFVAQNGVRCAALLAGGAALGVWWQVNARRAADVRRRFDEARSQEEHRLQDALREERSRVAQELHDVAGQHLASLMAHADNARRLTTEHPDRALQHIDGIRDEGRFATASVYAALSQLRAARDETATPGLTSLDELIEVWARRDAVITLDATVALDALPRVVSTTAYRGIQESLTNAAKHAPGAAVRIWIRRVREVLLVVVENDPTPPARGEQNAVVGLGWGLAGLGDRLRVLAGDLEAGRTEAGGWSVRMTLPLPEAAPALRLGDARAS